MQLSLNNRKIVVIIKRIVMDNEYRIEGQFEGTIHFDYLPCINYAMWHNQVSVCCNLVLLNQDSVDWQRVEVSVQGDFIRASSVRMDLLPAGQSVQVNKIVIVPEPAQLLSLTEGFQSEFDLTVCIDKIVSFQQKFPIFLMTFDQWTGFNIMPELLAAFVTPNHPLLSRVSFRASQYLEKWTGSSALDEYQTQNPNRVRLQIAAFYEALRSEALVYVTPPASFGNYGQRIRLVDKVLTEKLGTCLDLTLLFASCLEANGIHPILVIMKGHAFLGAWLTDEMYTQSVGDDAAFLLKGCSDGINDIVLVECTDLTASEAVSFEDAVLSARNALLQEENFVMFIDVLHCRLSQIRPLPQRILEAGEWRVENEGVAHAHATKKVNQLSRYELKLEDSQIPVTRQLIWERKLLDFSLRNNLLNMRIGRKVIPFVSFSIDNLEDYLQGGDTFQILSLPVRERINPDAMGMYNSSLHTIQSEELVLQGLQNKKIYAYLSASDLTEGLKYLYRESRTAFEENGANTLFLVLGVLKWYESGKSERERFAPLLLLPVDIVRKGGVLGYVIRAREEEIILNITLIELLKQEYKIELKGLNPLPTDESGVDVKKIFTIIRTCIRHQKGWDVLEESMLGLFSFNKFVMWNDIHSHADKLREHPILASLMENRLMLEDKVSEVDARETDRTCQPADFAIPVDVDSSQMEAIIEAGEGKSFILHGPPGTGKSQTITNMIANALYKGKRVLFVAEKMAALSVVQNRLARIGLNSFCLELHSNKVTKGHFLKQMQDALEVVHIQSPADYERISQDLYDKRKQLIDYMEALHRPHESGLSLYDCISRYLSIECEELPVDLHALPSVSLDWINHQEENICELDTIFRITGHPATHPLNGLLLKDSSENSRSRLEQLLNEYHRLLMDAIEYRKQAADLWGCLLPDTEQLPQTLVLLNSVLRNIPLLNAALFEAFLQPERWDELKAVCADGVRRDKMASVLLQNCAASFLDEDVFLLRQEWKLIQSKWVLPRFFAKRTYLNRLRMFVPTLQENDVNHLLDSLEEYTSYRKHVNVEQGELSRLFGHYALSGKENWEKITQVLDLMPQLWSGMKQLAEQAGCDIKSVRDQLLMQIDGEWLLFQQSHEAFFVQMEACVADINRVRLAMAELVDVEQPRQDYSQTMLTNMDVWLSHMDMAKDWYLWCRRREELLSQGLKMVVQAILRQQKSGAEVAKAFLKGLYHRLALHVVDSDEALRMFNGLLFDKLINKYQDLTHTFQELSKKELYCRLASRIPSQSMEAAANSEVGILKRNIGNGGRGTSIRRIIDQIPTLLPKLCPCMLMSPISVAQYVDLDREKFDLVIFDEASQMPTNEAVGAIARGKSLVVVGDPKQMPPTSFFTSSQVNEEEADLDDMESILDDCISLSIPSRYLTWHYRSKHESLIAFSNSQYYEGKLYTFPSIDDRASKIRLVHIDGTYDKGKTRCNKAEAEAIVGEVIRRLADEQLSTHSIGIISFSKVQQNLIEDLLTDELARHPELEKLAYQSEEPIFIKNLENVQGDERDVILFSIGYGPDKSGRVSMNFGPLNNKGGERRLNVAVSRARYEMVIFSTLSSEQIDLRRTQSVGVEGLKKFLKYAETGVSTADVAQIQARIDNCMASQIADELTARGYKVDMQVGRSNFKIDLAVVDGENPSCYMLGILCDGKNYYETKTTRDREIVQPGVLQMLGWQIERVWSIDWFTHRDKVVERIVNRLEDLSQHKAVVSQPVVSRFASGTGFSVADEPLVEAVNNRRQSYKAAEFTAPSTPVCIEDVLAAGPRVRQQLHEIIEIEQPITNILLYKRIVQAWGLQRVTSRIQALVDDLLREEYSDSSISDNVRTYWVSREASVGYDSYRTDSKRDIQEIPLVEVMNATLYVVEQQVSLPREDLKRIVAQQLGFSRKGTNLEVATEKAVQLLEEKGILCQDGDRMQKCSEKN